VRTTVYVIWTRRPGRAWWPAAVSERKGDAISEAEKLFDEHALFGDQAAVVVERVGAKERTVVWTKRPERS
jgi:hypothetical protein